MEKKIAGFSLSILIIFIVNFTYADTIYTKDGKVINVKTVGETNSTIWYEVEGGRLGIAKNSISKIEKNDSSDSTNSVTQEKVDPVYTNVEGVFVVEDPPTAEALKKYYRTMDKMKQDAPLFSWEQHICEHLPAIQSDEQIKIDAFLDLLKRKPELANKSFQIKGMSGTYYLDPEESKGNTIKELKKKYKCN